MSWRAITEADVLTQISGDELAAVRAAALQALQADPLAPTITQVTKEVRGFVAGCSRNVLDADGAKIPDELIGFAVAMIVPRLMARVAGLSIDKDEVRRGAQKDALAVMGKVASCDFAIEQTDTPTTAVVNTGSVQVISSTTRRATRAKMEGLT